MAIATLASRLTGFLRTVLLVVVVAAASKVTSDSYLVAFTLPTVINELLIGGVLTSVIIPVLVRAEKEDADHGEAFVRRMVTLSVVYLAIATAVAVALAPLLVSIYLEEGKKTSPELATAFSYLILPAIIFFGLGALFSAILNTKGVFGLPAWAPVMNNIIMIATLGVFALLPGEITLNPVQMTQPKVLVLGLGTTLGIAFQAMVMVPALRRSGVSLRPKWGWDPRLKQFGGLAGWAVLYAGISAAGFAILTRVASKAADGNITFFQSAWLLHQVPAGIIGVALLTAIMPRMSRAAADGDTEGVVRDLSLGSRLAAVALIPLSMIMTVLGPSIGAGLFGLRGGSSTENGLRIGFALAWLAFSILPFQVTMQQMRVFYATQDARTPTIINLIMNVFRIAAFAVVPAFFTGERVLYALCFIFGLAFVIGAVVGEFWLRARIGALGTREVLNTVLRTSAASLGGAVAILVVVTGLNLLIGSDTTLATSWARIIVGTAVGGGVVLVLMRMLKVTELDPVMAKISGLVRRG
ncbi:murein biosynthesis integral membrane protein MurJ [Pseudonocardiaceae bacterium YIM PH 21723]|nr:murein biosynthesis integral membrane protein MurJ [Pseudonocardiaceae bacterium YIM PH 21723]